MTKDKSRGVFVMKQNNIIRLNQPQSFDPYELLTRHFDLEAYPSHFSIVLAESARADLNSCTQITLIAEVEELIKELGFESVQEWCFLNNRAYSRPQLMIEKAGVLEDINQKKRDRVIDISLIESQKIHPLFGQIISDNLLTWVDVNLKIISPDGSAFSSFEADESVIRDKICSHLQMQAQKTLDHNGYPSFEAWEHKIRANFGFAAENRQ
jgi:hypothetical protein